MGHYALAGSLTSVYLPPPTLTQSLFFCLLYTDLEDRRPAANVDPYTVARLLIKTTLK